MKYLFILSGVVCLSFMLLPACAPQPEPEAAPEPVFDQAAEETAIRSFFREMFAELNNHDVEGVVTRADEAAEGWEGNLKGKEAWHKMWTDLWAHQKDRQYQLSDEIGIVFVTKDVAIFKTHVVRTGILDEEGNPQPQRKDLFAWVLVKKNGKWLWTTYFSRPIEE